MIYLEVGGSGPGLVPAEQGQIPVSDRGLLYGDGLFETMLVQRGQIPLLSLHLERLADSADALGIPCDAKRIRSGALALAASDTRANTDTYSMRITLTRGTGVRRGYAPLAADMAPVPPPTLLITCAPYRKPHGELTAITAPLRVNPESPLCRHKSLSALEKVISARAASEAGTFEALLLNTSGRVAEGTSSNLFIRRGSLWLTPPLSEGCLPGVMRRRIIRLADAVQSPLTPEDLFAADGVYLSNALLGLAPLSALDGNPLPSGGLPAFAAELMAHP